MENERPLWQANAYYIVALTAEAAKLLEVEDHCTRIVNVDDIYFLKLGISQDGYGNLYPNPQNNPRSLRILDHSELIALIVNDKVQHISKDRGGRLKHVIDVGFEAASEFKHLVIAPLDPFKN